VVAGFGPLGTQENPMAYLASLARLAIPASLGALLAAACGGKSFGDGGGEGASGAISSGGEGAQGGTSGGGKGNAGTSSKAGSAATGGAAAGGATWNDPACTLPPASGSCDAYFPSWYHDPSTGICRPFVYGGCDGNANRYDSLAACQKACRDGTPSYAACTQPTECVVSGGGCCGVCDHPGLSAHDLIAFNREHEAEVIQCGSGNVACAPCAGLQPVSLQFFVPSCTANRCVVEDIRTSAVSACQADTDCRLRNGTGCCEGCGSGPTVAVRNDGSFEKLVCGDIVQPCPDCRPLPNPEADAIAVCGVSGHCEVHYLP
jgi:Kunitz/Bovine pancreatic trypsin inhibitor domain